LYSGSRNNQENISFPELQTFPNFDRMPWRNVQEGWPVFHKMAKIDDTAHYVPIEEEECKKERLFDNDKMNVTIDKEKCKVE
jgi:hypothetical protein